MRRPLCKEITIVNDDIVELPEEFNVELTLEGAVGVEVSFSPITTTVKILDDDTPRPTPTPPLEPTPEPSPMQSPTELLESPTQPTDSPTPQQPMPSPGKNNIYLCCYNNNIMRAPTRHE